MVLSSRRSPAARSATTASAADAISPKRLARRMAPRVPIRGMRRERAQRRAAASSSTAVHPGFYRDKAKTPDSPLPRPHSRTTEGTSLADILSPQPLSRALRAGSDGGAARISLATGSGIRRFAASWSKRWRYPAFAMVMMGEALRTQISLTAGFRDDLLGSVLER